MRRACNTWKTSANFSDHSIIARAQQGPLERGRFHRVCLNKGISRGANFVSGFDDMKNVYAPNVGYDPYITNIIVSKAFQ